MRMTVMKRVRSTILIAGSLTLSTIAKDFDQYWLALGIAVVAGYVGGSWFMAEAWSWTDAQRTGRWR